MLISMRYPTCTHEMVAYTLMCMVIAITSLITKSRKTYRNVTEIEHMKDHFEIVSVIRRIP